MSADMESDHEQKRHKSSKRKHREEEEGADKMDVDETPGAAETPKKEKKKSKDKKRKDRTDEAGDDAAPADAPTPPEKKQKRQKSENKKEKKHKPSKHASPPSGQPTASADYNDSRSHQATVPEDKQYPFFTQTFSQRIPIWPAAFDEPLTKTAREYLDPMINRYSPRFRGVLLAYKNVNLSHRPQRANPHNPPTDDTPVALECIECYAPPFAWLTADLHLFVPSRGAWMEGEINLQSEGHIGVICFGKFNASISRRSLPRGWSWVEQPDDLTPAEEDDPFADKDEEGEEAGDGEEGEKETQEAPRLRSSGYWVDESGDKVGGKIYFRIKNFSSGSTGDYTYLSLQGTMLDDDAEKEAAAEEREMEKARRAKQNASGLLYPTMRLPEFSMTKLKDDLI